MNLNILGALKEARTRSINAGLNIVYEDKCKPRTDGRTIYLPKPEAHWSKEQWTMFWYFFEHELGHNVKEMALDLKIVQDKGIDCAGTLFGGVFNVLSDHRQEHYDNDVYLGRKLRLEEGNKQFHDSVPVHKFGKAGKDIRRSAMEAMYAWDLHEREEWMPTLTGYSDKIEEHFTEQQRDWLDKLKSGGYGSTLRSGITAEEQFELAERIIREVFELDPEEEGSEGKGEEGQGEEGEGEEGDEDNGQPVDADGDGDETKEEKGKAKKPVKVKYSDLLAHSHDDSSEDEKGNHSHYGGHIDYDKEIGGYFKSNLHNGIREMDLDKHLIDTSTSEYRHYSAEVNARIDNASRLSKKVRQLIQAKSLTRYQHSLKSGKLSVKNMYRTKLINSDSQTRVFKKKTINNSLDAAVYLLVDGSGSMSGHKYTHAIISAALLNEALGTLRIPTMISVFDDVYKSLRSGIVKKFDKMLQTSDIIDRMSYYAGHCMSNNSDGESILDAYNKLTLRRETKKVLIVISDGSPATGGKGDAMWFTQEVVKKIEKEKNIDIMAIGLEDDSVRSIYKRYILIDDASQLESELLKLVQRQIIGD